jgi:hypothetical protein
MIRNRKRAEWYEARGKIYTVRRLAWCVWQLTDETHRILAEGTRRQCVDAMWELRKGEYGWKPAKA